MNNLFWLVVLLIPISVCQLIGCTTFISHHSLQMARSKYDAWIQVKSAIVRYDFVLKSDISVLHVRARCSFRDCFVNRGSSDLYALEVIRLSRGNMLDSSWARKAEVRSRSVLFAEHLNQVKNGLRKNPVSAKKPYSTTPGRDAFHNTVYIFLKGSAYPHWQIC